MTRQNYGSLRGGGSGRRGGAWQWTVIGFVFGFGCAAILGLVLVITGATEGIGGLFTANNPTQTPFVITNTPEPFTPTPEPTEALLPTETPTVIQVDVLAPTATPTTDPALIAVEPSPTATVTAQSLLDQASNTAAQQQVSDIPLLLQNKLSILIPVSGGTFQMGTTAAEVANAVRECSDLWEATCDINWGSDSFPVHNVTVSPFQIEEREVTYDQYLAFLNSLGPNRHRNGCQGQLCIVTRGEDENSNIIFDSVNYRVNAAISEFPVVGVTWYGAAAYCEAIGRRLPTEAEWERAARGPQDSLYPWGNTFDTSLARTSRPRETDAALIGPRRVASYPPSNALYDMSGNVAEWVFDWYSPTYYTIQAQSTAPDPSGPPAGVEKVVRGGSWDAVPFFARTVHRQSRDPLNPSQWIGFRCAAETSANTTGGTTNNLLTGGTPVQNQLIAPTTSAATGGNEETTSNAAPTLPAPPIQPTQNSGPLPTLDSGG
ncbi:MAG: SUMF1/EgtB/PvdO family nonheme iron enzyme [Anaerolineae bacterium]|nr:SUMF1/EgtB/PvdO family nonheme iron enzyme [Anaerolineae bacterium]